jgi:hypothetical protein
VPNSVCLARRPSSASPSSMPQRRSTLGSRSIQSGCQFHIFHSLPILNFRMRFLHQQANQCVLCYDNEVLLHEKDKKIATHPSPVSLLSQLIADDFAVNRNFM